MSFQQLDIQIDADGKVRIEVSGVAGSSCEELTQPLEDALGVVEARDYISDYYDSRVTRTNDVTDET